MGPGLALVPVCCGSRQGERAFQQANGPWHVLLRAQEYADPSRIRKHMMWLGVAAGHQFVSHGFREGNVQQPVTVDVPELPPAQTELQAAVTVWLDLDVGPVAGRLDDASLCSWNRHGFLLS